MFKETSHALSSDLILPSVLWSVTFNQVHYIFKARHACVSVAECYLATFQLRGGVPLPRGSLERRALMISSLQSEGVDPCTARLMPLHWTPMWVACQAACGCSWEQCIADTILLLYVLTSRPIYNNNLSSATPKIPFQPKSTAVQFKWMQMQYLQKWEGNVHLDLLLGVRARGWKPENC